MVGIAKVAVKRNLVRSHDKSFAIFAALLWGSGMWLYTQEKDAFQPSFQSTLNYLYRDSDKWTSVKNWFLFNK
jgi:peroxisomal membrane protein 4